MRMLINGVPRVCESLVDDNLKFDTSACNEILKYCKPGNSEDECIMRLFGHATVNSIKALPGTIHSMIHKGGAAIDKLIELGMQDQIKLEHWYYVVAPTRIEDMTLSRGLMILGAIIENIIPTTGG